MLRQLYELAKQLFSLAQETQQNKADIKALQEQVEELTNVVQTLAFELRRARENEAHEREKMALRLENSLVRFERRLPQDGEGRE